MSLQKGIMNDYLETMKKGQNWSIKLEKQKYNKCMYRIYVYTRAQAVSKS